MSQQIDLRKYHINDDSDAENFLEFVEARLPELRKVFGKHQLKIASLTSRAEFAEQRAGAAPVMDPANIASVGDRMTGNGPAAFTPQAESPSVNRLAQLKAVGTADPDIAKSSEVVDTTASDPLNLPAAPGEIGTLNIDDKPTDLSATLGGADPITAESQMPSPSFGIAGRPLDPPTDVQLEAAQQAIMKAVNDANEATEKALDGDTTLDTPITVTRTQMVQQDDRPVDLMAMAQGGEEDTTVTDRPATGQAVSGEVLSDTKK